MSTKQHTISLMDTGESFRCSSAETALHALAKSGKRGIPIGCRGGGCGVCKVKVLSGNFKKRQMSRAHVSEVEESNREVLACCIYPEGDIQVQVIGKLRRVVLRGVELQGK